MKWKTGTITRDVHYCSFFKLDCNMLICSQALSDSFFGFLFINCHCVMSSWHALRKDKYHRACTIWFSLYKAQRGFFAPLACWKFNFPSKSNFLSQTCSYRLPICVKVAMQTNSQMPFEVSSLNPSWHACVTHLSKNITWVIFGGTIICNHVECLYLEFKKGLVLLNLFC